MQLALPARLALVNLAVQILFVEESGGTDAGFLLLGHFVLVPSPARFFELHGSLFPYQSSAKYFYTSIHLPIFILTSFLSSVTSLNNCSH
eukprot:m.34898 g.34898  ORF g.34898 m.34898 type:complete len:90 (-) comp8799_c0_seq2:336-605(-)